MSNLFLYCFFGKVATESYEQISDCMFQANWVTLPVKYQKYFILMIGNSHRPFYFHGFKFAILNLETFTKVNKFIKFFFTKQIIERFPFPDDANGSNILYDVQNNFINVKMLSKLILFKYKLCFSY